MSLNISPNKHLLDNSSEIITAFQRGDQQTALGVLYRTVLPNVRGYILKNSGSEEDAKDIFQDAVMILYKQLKMNKLEITQSVESYLFSVARNLWINKAKRDARASYVEEVPEPTPDGRGIMADLISKEREDRILGVLDQLGERCATLLKYVFYMDYTLAEVTEKMGFSSSEVAHTTHYRCKKKLINLVSGNTDFKNNLLVGE